MSTGLATQGGSSGPVEMGGDVEGVATSCIVEAIQNCQITNTPSEAGTGNFLGVITSAPYTLGWTAAGGRPSIESLSLDVSANATDPSQSVEAFVTGILGQQIEFEQTETWWPTPITSAGNLGNYYTSGVCFHNLPAYYAVDNGLPVNLVMGVGYSQEGGNPIGITAIGAGSYLQSGTSSPGLLSQAGAGAIIMIGDALAQIRAKTYQTTTPNIGVEGASIQIEGNGAGTNDIQFQGGMNYFSQQYVPTTSCVMDNPLGGTYYLAQNNPNGYVGPTDDHTFCCDTSVNSMVVRLTNPSGNPREVIVADIGGNASVNPIQINDQDTDTILTSITTNGGVCIIRYLINSAGNAVVPFVIFQR